MDKDLIALGELLVCVSSSFNDIRIALPLAVLASTSESPLAMSGFDPVDLNELNRELATRLSGDCGGDCITADDRAKTLGIGGELAGMSSTENA
jgi:hypothetical protein|tara:strand:- start:332 stop:613 length:282 start_codon:yes stop_codon:yes gene_type:complete